MLIVSESLSLTVFDGALTRNVIVRWNTAIEAMPRVVTVSIALDHHGFRY